MSHLHSGKPIRIWPHVLSLRLEANSGAAFGILPQASWVLVAVAVLVVIAIPWIWRQAPSTAGQWGFGLVLGGALGNLLDRLIYGRVIDFIDVHFWPGIFNMADSAIVVGACLIVFYWRRR